MGPARGNEPGSSLGGRAARREYTAGFGEAQYAIDVRVTVARQSPPRGPVLAFPSTGKRVGGNGVRRRGVLSPKRAPFMAVPPVD